MLSEVGPPTPYPAGECVFPLTRFYKAWHYVYSVVSTFLQFLVTVAVFYAHYRSQLISILFCTKGVLPPHTRVWCEFTLYCSSTSHPLHLSTALCTEVSLPHPHQYKYLQCCNLLGCSTPENAKPKKKKKNARVGEDKMAPHTVAFLALGFPSLLFLLPLFPLLLYLSPHSCRCSYIPVLINADQFGNAIFGYSELPSQYHIDASIDVNPLRQECDKTSLLYTVRTVAADLRRGEHIPKMQNNISRKSTLRVLRQPQSKYGGGGGGGAGCRTVLGRATRRSACRWVLHNCRNFKLDRIWQIRQRHHQKHQEGSKHLPSGL
jgi:hypothetical protein